MSAYTNNEQELNEGLFIVEAEERLEMVQAAPELGISCCGDSSVEAVA